jgi:predicted GNAT superfamily acetyltransferase
MCSDICDIDESDLGEVLELNQAEVPHVGSIDIEEMRWFAANAAFFKVIRRNGAIAAYLVGMRPGTTYASPNYRWFCSHYEDFAYVDRVAVAASARRLGLATRLYADFAEAVRGSVDIMTCEVNVRPANEPSMIFHRGLGFQQVGSLVSDDGRKEVAMLLKTLA